MADFTSILLKSAKDALRKTLGESAAAAIDFYCDPSTLAEDSGKYSEDLAKLFGMGASILEDVIVRELYSRLGLRYKKKSNRRFTDYIAEAEKTYRSK
ncbi:MAG: hypothetical protein ACE5KU_04945 [Nitrososphaerales archaeon]